ncbi:hypothetical protein [Paenibacillus xylanexedens]|uniref:hypothetical protein n=1 Tax=Paenibacillus xylanexedens TaxID=528191 RepID=UPI0011AABAAC|nr:hypothetical protein [Paenibacillus xylanexedens]
MLDLRSFALWYSLQDPNLDPNKEATVHINLWDQNQKNKAYCFDFGLLIEDVTKIDKVFLYAPFKIERNQITDLGNVISNNQLVNAIFNEDFTTTEGQPKRLIVNGVKNKPDFIIYSLDKEEQITLRKCKSRSVTPGTIIELDIKGIKLDVITRYYFRLRLKVNKNDIKLINDEIQGLSFLNDHFTNTEIIDFRLNDIRSCSEELREQFQKGCKFNFLAIHYLILRNANDVIIQYGKDINSRMLENDLWKDYIEGVDFNIIAYHMKSKAMKVIDPNTGESIKKYVEDFSDLSRFQYKKGTNFVISCYIGGIVLLGAVAGVCGNWLSQFLLK